MLLLAESGTDLAAVATVAWCLCGLLVVALCWLLWRRVGERD